jgi:hypothetical protein
MKKQIILICIMFLPILGQAQDAAERAAVNPLIENGPRFFVAIIAGVLLAFAFQIIMTMLSVAAGVTAVGDIQKKANSSNKNQHSSDSGGSNTGKKISAGIGVWTMVTSSISLFFASLLAVKLSLIGVNFVGVTLGLVIWAAFFMLMTYIEANAVSSLVGGMVNTVTGGVKSMFGKSPENEAKSVAKVQAHEQADAMRKQFEKLFNNNDLDKKIEDYIDRLEPQRIDIEHIKKEIKSLLQEIQVTETTDSTNMEVIKKMIIEEAEGNNLSKEDMEKVKGHLQNLKNISQKPTSNEDKVKQGIEQLTNADREQINKYQEQIKHMLSNTRKDELQPERIERDLNEIFNDPKKATSVIKEKASALDRQTLIKLISAREDVDEQEAQQYVQKVENVLNKLKSSTDENTGKASWGAEETKSRIKQIFQGKKGEAQHKLQRIKSDFTSLFRSSGDNAELKYKLKNYSKEQMLTMVTARTSLSRSEAEPIVDKIVEARDFVLQKADEIESKVKEKIEETKQVALKKAEESRQLAASAAWWLLATAVVSGIASAIGGMVALNSGML